MKKKLIAILIAGLLAVGAFGLIGCTTTDDFRVDAFVYSRQDEYADVLAGELENTLKDGIKLTVHDAEWSGDKQMSQIESVLARGTDLMLVALRDYTMGPQVANMAAEKGIQVIFYTREPYDDNMNTITDHKNTAFVGLRNDVAGQLQGELLAHYLTDENSPYKVENGTTVNYIMFRGNVGNPAADERTSNTISKANELLQGTDIVLHPLVQDVDTAWMDAEAHDSMETLLGQYSASRPQDGGDNGEINLILGNSDALTLGAINALQGTQQWNMGDLEQSILALGMDASTPGKQAIENKYMAATIEGDIKFNAQILARMVKNVMDGEVEQGMVKGLVEDLSQEGVAGKEVFVEGRMVGFDFTKWSGNL